ncbi:MAG TPA: helix-turn-helix transcriptional regulator [Bacteroidia bacterium]|nr:helix-turn-helix transcriptional regulator [Bacteroidia bacterium]
MLLIIFQHAHLWRVKYYKDTKFIKAFGKNLRKIRLQKGMSQEYLADEVGIPTNQVGRIERGEVNTSISTANALANSLGIKVVELFEFIEKE